jgi:leucine dehydrogenase
MFGHPEFDDHEQVVFASDRESGLRCIIAIHSTALGPAFGGCRMRPYTSEAEALADALHLSRGMTFKAGICELPYGGGKAVVIGDPRKDKSRPLLRALGRAVDALGGRYIVAEDVGTTLADLAVLREVTTYTAAATGASQQPLAVTAYGVLMALRAAAGLVFGSTGLSGRVIAVQGLGNVGFPLCGYLHREGAMLIVSDVDPRRSARAARAFGARPTPPEAILDEAADIFAPCALGGVLDRQTIQRLKVRIVCGGANNQLAEPGLDVDLAERGILYVPDYLANAGGVIDFHQERVDDRPEAVLRAVDRIHDIVGDVLARAGSERCTPLQIADRLVRQRVSAMRCP